MRFTQKQRFSSWPSVGRLLLLAASLFFCFITGVGSVTAQTTDDHGNSLGDATNLPLGSSITGRISPGDDLDVFRLDLSGASGTTHVWLYTTGNLDSLGGLYDSNINLIASNDNTASGGVIVETNFRIPRTLTPGVYYVAVYSADSTTTGDYTLHAKSDDHGGFLDTATTLALGSSVAGHIDPGFDRDFFKLDLSGESGTTHVWIYTTGSLDTQSWLYDSNINLIASNDNTTSGGVIVETNFRIPGTLAPGVYYVAVYSADSTTTGDYTLHAKSDDHGHSSSVATALSLGSAVAGSIDPDFDRDVFKLDLSGASGTTDVWIYTAGSLDTQGWLYDSNGDLLEFDDNTTSGGVIVETNFRIPGTLAPGVYYVAVYSADSTTTGDYTLHAKSDDHGGFLDTATTLSLGSSVAGSIDPDFDRDVFKLDLSGASGTTDVWIYTAGDLDTQGWLLGSSGDLLVFNQDSFIDGRRTNFHLRRNLSSGVYYLEVQSRDGAIGDYTLYAEAVTGPGSAIGTAATLSLDSPTPGMIDTTSDADYFRLVLTESKNLVIYTYGLALHDGSNFLPIDPLDGVVLDNNGAEISVNMYDENIGGYRWGFRIEDDFSPGAYYVKVTAPAADTTYPVPYTIHAYEDTDYTGFIERCEAPTVSLNNPQINDSLYSCQWHLRNQEPGGEDINVEPVWAEGINGEGINVAVVDDTMDYSHEDLVGNINSSLNHDYAGMGGAYRPFDHHGTAVAGVIAARDNGIGVRGVASKATVYGYNWLAGDWQQFKDINRADAMSRNRVVTAVSNNSWGPPDGPWLGYANQLWKLAVDSGIREGYDGKGVFYVFAGGNGGRGHRENPDGTLVGGHVDNIKDRGDDSNLDELANYYAVTAVCAVNDQDTRSSYSEKGANLWVCAPSGDSDQGHRGIVTTENSDRYRDDFSGTSAATPIVSGVAALLRQANPDLTWRDLKLILAASARKNDAANPGWAEGARKYGSGSAADRYHFNHEYGFGVVDARAAVALARGWTNVPTLESVSAASEAAVTIPPPSGSAPQTVTTTLALNTGIRFTEFVEINTDFDHMSFRDMEIELVSPSGAVSKLAVPFNTRYYHTDELFLHPTLGEIPRRFYVQLDGEFRFGSARHLGEDPNGQWTLRLTDHFPALGGTLRSWSIKVYGHVSRPGAPTITTPITAGADSLTVAWSAPSDSGGPAITAYDLRYIQTSADETVDANWTVKEDVWAAGSGSLQYTLSGLTVGTRYDVQVRAVNAAGASAWSATVTGTTTSAVVPGAPTGLTAAVAAGKAQVVLSWIAPTDTGGAPITGYKIEASDDGSNPWTEVYTTTGDATGYTDEGADSNGPMFEVGTTRHYRVSAINSVGTGPPSNVAVTEGLVARYDTNNNGTIEKNEVIAAINDYLFGEGDEAISKGDVIRLINLYLFG